MGASNSLTLSVLAAAVSGCASVGGVEHNDRALSWSDVSASRASEIVANQPAPAPQGLSAFCVRLPDTCEGADAQTAHAALFTTAAFDNRPTLTPVWQSQAGENGASVFSRLLAMRTAGQSYHYAHRIVALNEPRWRELQEVNRLINLEIEPASDQDTYQRAEYWALPISQPQTAGPPRGDCEDYALEKRERLIALGWDREALSLAVAHVAGVGFHTVLIAQTDRGDFVLDNFHNEPRTPQSLHYRWLSRQAGGSLASWATARLEAQPANQQDLIFAQAGLNAAGR